MELSDFIFWAKVLLIDLQWTLHVIDRDYVEINHLAASCRGMK